MGDVIQFPDRLNRDDSPDELVWVLQMDSKGDVFKDECLHDGCTMITIITVEL